MQEKSTAEVPVSQTKEAIIDEAKRIEENCLYSSKGHLVAAEFWTKFNYWIGIPTAILAAIGGLLSFSQHSNASGPGGHPKSPMYGHLKIPHPAVAFKL